MAAKKKGRTKTTPDAPQVISGILLTHQQIAERAFLIWLAKGRLHGQDLENWYEAEAQLENEDEKSQAAKA